MAGKFETPRTGRGSTSKAAPRAGREKAARQGAPAPERKAPSQAARSGTGRIDIPSRMPPLRPENETAAAPHRSSGSSPAPRTSESAHRSVSSRQSPSAPAPRRRKKRINILPIFLSVLALVIAAGLVIAGIRLFASIKKAPAPGGMDETIHIDIPVRETTVPEETEPEPEPTEPEPEHVIATASIASVGDLLMHKPIVDNARRGDTWDFSDIFRFLSPYLAEADYSVGNLETTFGGTDYPYQGNPAFNTPDVFAQDVKNAGFDMLLTVNNHCYDTLMTGLRRSLEVSREAGLKTIGTRLSEDEKRYEIVDINGIQVGMIAYSYSHGRTDAGVPRMNVNTPVEQPALVNYFYQDRPDDFYAEIEPLLAQMREEGAEAIMVYLHWGVEYQLTENSTQDAIAQKLCDMGVDVIVGGHPHVVQPMALLTSSVDPDHKTVCVYSLGNIVSNQRLGNIGTVSTAHTEDGAMFTATFEKYSDGKVYLASVRLLPTWVNMYIADGRRHYDILPLDDPLRDSWQSTYGLTDAFTQSCQKSYERTMAIMGDGLRACMDYLQEQKTLRDTPPGQLPAQQPADDAA